MSVTDKVTIGRQSLAVIGSQTGIESFTENSPEARILGVWFEHCRKAVLDAYDFSFSRETGELAPHASAPTNNWLYRYTMPANALRFRRVLGDSANNKVSPHELSLVGEEITILTDKENAVGQWTTDLGVLSLFSPRAVESLIYLLASKIAGPLMGDTGVKMAPEFFKMHNMYLRQAASDDYNSSRTREESTPDVLTVR